MIRSLCINNQAKSWHQQLNLISKPSVVSEHIKMLAQPWARSITTSNCAAQTSSLPQVILTIFQSGIMRKERSKSLCFRGASWRLRYPALKPFEHHDRGKDADPKFPNLLKEGVQLEGITSSIGAEVKGIQLSQLSNAGKDELALLVAKYKVVAFRDQDFADQSIQQALDYCSYFGRLHVHPASGAPKGYPEVHLVHRGAEDTSFADFLQERTNSIAWHSDVTYELQPPGTTFLYALDVPAAGGDTLFVNQVKAYQRLSPAFQERLAGLKAVHSGHEQAESSIRRGGVYRRDPVSSIHPLGKSVGFVFIDRSWSVLVRTHPATGEKALYVNPQFTRYIVGFKKEESEYLLKFLYDHIALSQDIQCRVKWAPKSVVVWDNRVTAHSALIDWENGARRHIARITPQAEQPYETWIARQWIDFADESWECNLQVRSSKVIHSQRHAMLKKLAVLLSMIYSPSSLATTVLISSSPYMRNPCSFVTLASCTFFESSFSSMTCFNVFNTKVSASSNVKDLWYSDCSSACAPSLPDPIAFASYL